MSAYKWPVTTETLMESPNDRIAESSLLSKVESLLKQFEVVQEGQLARELGRSPFYVRQLLEPWVCRGTVVRLAPLLVSEQPAPDQIFYRWRRPDDSRYRWQQFLFAWSMDSKLPSVEHKV